MVNVVKLVRLEDLHQIVAREGYQEWTVGAGKFHEAGSLGGLLLRTRKSETPNNINGSE
jgi:hypothetical protein